MTLNVPATYYYYKYPPPPKAGLILTYWPKFKKGLVDALFCHIKCNSQWVGYFWDKSISNLRMFMFLINLEIGSFQVDLKAQKTDFALILFWVKVPVFPQKIIMYLSNAEFHISDTFWHLYALLHLHCEFKLKIKQTNVYIYTKQR